MRGLSFFAALVIAVSVGPELAGAPSDALAAEPAFERDIRPILREHCLDCHGARAEKKSGLDLRLVRLMVRGGERGPAIAPGDARASLLLRRVRAGEMPPGDTKVPAEQIARIERWIAAGAPTLRPEPETIGQGVGITPEERAFWSFRPIERPSIPRTGPDDHARTPVDALLLDRLRERGLALSPDADRRTLIARLSLDFLGLPPSRDEIEEFVRDESPDAFERLVDRLLASPHFGERWARHWLDVAGYADSEGATNADARRAWAWRYRDWVIDAFNQSMPLDRFLIEQLAGDELAGQRDGDWTETQIDLLTATGFLRMAADGTGSGENTPEGRNKVVADTLKIVGSSLLGVSLACAQCHDHRYDPILQTDYYAVRSIFEPALDWQRWQAPGARLVSLRTRADRERAGEIEARAAKLVAERRAKQDVFIAAALEKELAKYEEPLRDELRRARETPDAQRSEEQKSLLAAHPNLNITPGVLYQYDQKAADELKAMDARIAEVRATKPPEEFVRALVEPRDHAPRARLFHRGDHRQPQGEVAPAVPVVLAPEGAVREITGGGSAVGTSGRRLAFARWLGSGDNPLTARVLANRVWLHLLGRAMVETPGDFGTLGARPTHPRVLDFLADALRSEGWDHKRLVRLIAVSTAYRQSSRAHERGLELDPANALMWRRAVRRLDAEELRDRVLAASGRLDVRMGGPPVAIKEDETGQVVVADGSGRRSVYVEARRSQPVALLTAFDAPVMETNCERRPSSTVATQSLMLLNGAFVIEQAAHLAERSRREASTLVAPGEESAIANAVAAAWRLAYGRDVTTDELRVAVDFVEGQVEELSREPGAVPEGRSAAEQALTNLCHVLLISNEFLYVD